MHAYHLVAMKPLLTALMLGNAAVFVFGALQHAGVAIGSLHEPVIVPASVVEVLCALALSWGAAAVFRTKTDCDVERWSPGASSPVWLWPTV
jgi:hypothetical protein